MDVRQISTPGLVTLLGLAWSTHLARADQPAPAPAAAETPAVTASDAVEPGAVVVADDPAWRQYDAAFALLGKDRVAGARQGLLQLTTRWPAHPAAAQATLRLADLEAGIARRAARDSGRDRTARGELVFWSTAGSVLVARNLCIDNCDGDRVTAGVYALTIGAGLGLSLLATRHGVRPAEAQLYNSAQTWGSWNALALNDGFADDRQEAALAIGAQFAGLGAGLALWPSWRPDPGEVGLANSGLLWGAVISLWGHLAVDEEPSLATVVVLGDVGLVAGALIGHSVPMSRGRTLLIDLGGVLGTVAGGLVALAANDEQAAGVILVLATGAGLGIAGAATRHWDVKAPQGLRIVPARVGTVGAGAGWGAAIALEL